MKNHHFKKNDRSSSIPSLKALLWWILGMIVGSLYDSLTKYLSADLNYVGIGFFMFLLEGILLLPYVFRQSGPVLYKRKNIWVHMVRDGLIGLGCMLIRQRFVR